MDDASIFSTSERTSLKNKCIMYSISTFSLECLICFMYVFLSVCLLQVRFVYPCVTSYHFYAPTKATRILGRPTTSPIQMASLINALVLQIIRCLLNLSLKPADSKFLLCQRKAVVSNNYCMHDIITQKVSNIRTYSCFGYHW